MAMKVFWTISFLCTILWQAIFVRPTWGQSLEADFQHLNQWASEEEANIGVFGGSAKKRILPIEAKKSSYEIKNQELWISFEKEGQISITPTALALKPGWYGMQSLKLSLKSDKQARLLFMIYGVRTRKIDTLALNKGHNNFLINLEEVPLLGGIQAHPLYLRLYAAEALNIRIQNLTLVNASQSPFLVDRWGQRAQMNYPEKVKDIKDPKNKTKEQTFLDSLSQHHPVDRYGAYLNHSLEFEKTGFFRTEYTRDRWWLVSPEGNPFFSLGINGVRVKSFRGNADVTRVESREHIFEQLPDYEECPACFRENGKYFSFYCWNVIRKYATFVDWRDHIYQRLKKIGLNTIGNWSDTLFYKDAQLPYTYTLDTRANKSFVMQNHLPDVFHPGWAKHLEQTFADILKFKNNPFLLGYFVDNEMGWRSITHWDSASYTFEKLHKLASPEEQKRQYAEKYFSTIHSILKKYDPNHLYLGCRFTRNFNGLETIAKEAGKYVDILSVNIYSAVPIREETDRWYQAAQKPILIGEHHIPPITQKQFLPHYPAFPEPRRSQMIEDYVKTWVTYPYALGSHWYQFKDQEVAGRGDGGENQPVGLITIADQLNVDLAKVYHKLSQWIPSGLGL